MDYNPEVNKLYRENLLLKQSVKDLNEKARLLDEKVRNTQAFIDYSKKEIILNAKKDFQIEIDNLNKELAKKDAEIKDLNSKLEDSRKSESKFRDMFYELDNKNYDIAQKEISDKIEKEKHVLNEKYQSEKQKLIEKYEKMVKNHNKFLLDLDKIAKITEQYRLK